MNKVNFNAMDLMASIHNYGITITPQQAVEEDDDWDNIIAKYSSEFGEYVKLCMPVMGNDGLIFNVEVFNFTKFLTHIVKINPEADISFRDGCMEVTVNQLKQ